MTAALIFSSPSYNCNVFYLLFETTCVGSWGTRIIIFGNDADALVPELLPGVANHVTLATSTLCRTAPARSQKAVRGFFTPERKGPCRSFSLLLKCHFSWSQRHSFLLGESPWIPILSRKGAVPLLTSKLWLMSWTGELRRRGDGEKSVSVEKCLFASSH